MEEFSNPQLWFKSLHIISVIAWMAGLLYLPRLFVYHADSDTGGEAAEKFKIMERRLLKFIMTPAMVFSWVFGLLAAIGIYAFFDIWFYSKIAIVIIMTYFHFHLATLQKKFETDQNTHSKYYYKLINEVPTVLMICVVFLVVFKPF